MENYKRLLIGSEPRLLRKHNGYYYKVGDVPAITILGNFCGLRDLEDYTRDEQLRKTMDTATEPEKQGGKIVKRTGFVTDDIGWSACPAGRLPQKAEWANLACIGAIVHLGEDGYKVRDKNIQLNSNIIRKHVINSIKTR
ncbi:MAG: hypothetical protein LBD85_07185, partial [Oscillospiraceae bacterium]|nr:hypothetical protein [Oscillospiraceae bacterium]